MVSSDVVNNIDVLVRIQMQADMKAARDLYSGLSEEDKNYVRQRAASTREEMQNTRMLNDAKREFAAQDARERQERIAGEQYYARLELDVEKGQNRIIQDRINTLNLENKAMRERATAATQNLGYNLGLLFSSMAVARSINQTTIYLEKYGIVSEGVGKKFRAFGEVINLVSTLFGAYVSVMMLVQAMEARRVQTRINQNTQDIVFLQQQKMINRELATQAALSGSRGLAGAGAGVATGASVGMASAIPYVGIALLAAGLGLAAYSMYKSSKHALGTDELVTSPRMMYVGENGPERVSVTPMGSSGGGRGGTTINFYGNSYGDLQLRQTLSRIITDAQRGVA